ncbi:MAG: hypothetical protein PQJ61_12285 [Spirochaetales bacterium]|uniref:Uncharacterized protein n=1 Tax=Candidatus Thalassospirochaeta sargassi TaxID=3119039 RepID=A0AAJ1IDY3_9SPIO|nr:hypothetical protein [Spirochaetales bacterium]
MKDWELIYSYSRDDAMRDGVLRDVTYLAKQYGFRLNTAITETLWHIVGGDEEEIKDLLVDLWIRIKQTDGKVSMLIYDYKIGKRTVKIRSEVGPGDDAYPVLTIGTPHDF